MSISRLPLYKWVQFEQCDMNLYIRRCGSCDINRSPSFFYIRRNEADVRDAELIICSIKPASSRTSLSNWIPSARLFVRSYCYCRTQDTWKNTWGISLHQVQMHVAIFFSAVINRQVWPLLEKSCLIYEIRRALWF